MFLSLQEGGDETETSGNQAEIWWAFILFSLLLAVLEKQYHRYQRLNKMGILAISFLAKHYIEKIYCVYVCLINTKRFTVAR